MKNDILAFTVECSGPDHSVITHTFEVNVSESFNYVDSKSDANGVVFNLQDSDLDHVLVNLHQNIHKGRAR